MKNLGCTKPKLSLVTHFVEDPFQVAQWMLNPFSRLNDWITKCINGTTNKYCINKVITLMINTHTMLTNNPIYYHSFWTCMQTKNNGSLYLNQLLRKQRLKSYLIVIVILLYSGDMQANSGLFWAKILEIYLTVPDMIREISCHTLFTFTVRISQSVHFSPNYKVKNQIRYS